MLIARGSACWLAALCSPLGTTLPPFAPALTVREERALGDCGVLTASDKPTNGLIWATSGYKLASRNGWHNSSERNSIVGPAHVQC